MEWPSAENPPRPFLHALAGLRIAGSLWAAGGGRPIEFRLWVEEGAARPLPLRIEYQPKSYLRLTFEATG